MFHWTNRIVFWCRQWSVTSQAHMALSLSVHLLSVLMPHFHFQQNPQGILVNWILPWLYRNVTVSFLSISDKRPQHTNLISTINCLMYINFYQLDLCILFLIQFISFFVLQTEINLSHLHTVYFCTAFLMLYLCNIPSARIAFLQVFSCCVSYFIYSIHFFNLSNLKYF